MRKTRYFASCLVGCGGLPRFDQSFRRTNRRAPRSDPELTPVPSINSVRIAVLALAKVRASIQSEKANFLATISRVNLARWMADFWRDGVFRWDRELHHSRRDSQAE
jgi:hypothetical protein